MSKPDEKLQARGGDMETCGKCMGSGYGGHPDSGALCPDCNGSGVYLNEAPAAIAKLGAGDGRVVTLWQPIETAPRGGEWFMARTAHGTTRAVHFADEYDRFPISHDGVVWSTAPVEWMPLNVFPDLLARIAALTAQLAEEQAHSERQASGHREDLNEIADVSVKRLRRAEAAEAESAALRAKVARLEGALGYYADQYCEGFCQDLPPGYTDENCERDCGGCKARAALAKIKE